METVKKATACLIKEGLAPSENGEDELDENPASGLTRDVRTIENSSGVTV